MAGFTPENVRVFGSVKIPAKYRILNPVASITIRDQDGNEIGFITDITIRKTRRVERARHLSMADAGVTVEQLIYPEDITLDVTGFTLYSGFETPGPVLARIYNAKGDHFYFISEKQEPFHIWVEDQHPAGGGKKFIRKFLDCFLTNSTEPISVGRMQIAETASIQPTWGVWTLE